MDGPGERMLSEIRQRKTNTIQFHSYVESNGQTEPTRKMGTDSDGNQDDS